MSLSSCSLCVCVSLCLVSLFFFSCSFPCVSFHVPHVCCVDLCMFSAGRLVSLSVFLSLFQVRMHEHLLEVWGGERVWGFLRVWTLLSQWWFTFCYVFTTFFHWCFCVVLFGRTERMARWDGLKESWVWSFQSLSRGHTIKILVGANFLVVAVFGFGWFVYMRSCQM